MKCAIYARYSSEEQTGSSTIDSQIRECRVFIARQQGWEEIPNMIFVDEAKSGTSTANRDEFNRMIEVAKSPECRFNAIVVWNRARFSRSPDDVALYERMLKFRGISVISASEPTLNTPEGTFMKRVVDGSNEYFIAKLAIETKRGQRQNVLEGGFSTGGTAPFGYKAEYVVDPLGRLDRSGKKKLKTRWILDQAAASIVRRIFDLYLAGNGLKAIANILNRSGAQAPRGKGWDTSSVRYVLYNETYLGRRIYGKCKKIKLENGNQSNCPNPKDQWIVKEGAHEAIIQMDLWSKAQERKRQVRSMGPGGKTKAAYTTHLLSGIVICGACGARFVASASYAGRFHYRCGWNSRRGSTVCSNGARINAEKLETMLVNALYSKMLTSETIRYLLVRVNEILNNTKDGAVEKSKQFESALKKVEQEITNLVRAIQEGAVAFPAIKEALEGCEDKKAKLLLQLEELHKVEERTLFTVDQSMIERHLFKLREVLLKGPVQKIRELVKQQITEMTAFPDGSIFVLPATKGMLEIAGAEVAHFAGAAPSKQLMPTLPDFWLIVPKQVPTADETIA